MRPKHGGDAIALELSKKGCEKLLVEAVVIQFVMDAFGGCWVTSADYTASGSFLALKKYG